MINLIQVLVLALVEGVTEFLPISSTGHLILVSNLMGIMQSEFVKSFEIVIQLGAIMAVAGMYAKSVWGQWQLVKRIIIAFIPTGILGFFGYKLVKQYLIGDISLTLWALFIGGILMIVFERFRKIRDLKITDLGWKQAVVIGLAQSVSMIPGVSRAMATIMGGMFMGLSRKEAVEMSFILAVPTMAAATGLDLVKSGWQYSTGEWGLIGLGLLGSFFSAWFTVKWLLGFVQKHDFKVFGYYRIALAAVWWAVLSTGGVLK
jgi:undecaprenyl-diphosphatase